MASLVQVDEYLLQGGHVDWLERKWGESGRVTLQVNTVAEDGTKTPLDLTQFVVAVVAVEIQVNVVSTPPNRRTGQTGTLLVSDPAVTGDAPHDLKPQVPDQVGADVGKITFVFPTTRQDNPEFGAGRLPAQVIWIELHRASTYTTVMRPFAAFYRTGRPR